jgi:hypothetical protein
MIALAGVSSVPFYIQDCRRFTEDRMKANHRPLYIFFHLPKCAGSTMRTHIEENLRPGERLGLYHGKEKALSREEVFRTVESLSGRERNALKLIYGHEAYYGLHEYFDRPVRYFTFFRNPIDRAFSFYNYHMTLAVKSGERNAGELPGFIEWLNGNPWMIDEMLGCCFDYGYHPRTTEITDQVFKDILDKFYFVGLTERHDEDALFIFHKLGFQRFFPAKNASNRYFRDRSPEILEAIATASVQDRKLFERAVLRNAEDRKRENYGSVVRYMGIKKRVMQNAFEAEQRVKKMLGRG